MPGAQAASMQDSLDQIVEVLRRGQRFLVTSHCRPDGDAVGSMLAMGMLLEQMGKSADLVTADRVPVVYRSLPRADSIRSAMRVHGPYDAVILLECDGLERARLWASRKFPDQYRSPCERPRVRPHQLDRLRRSQRGRNGVDGF